MSGQTLHGPICWHLCVSRSWLWVLGCKESWASSLTPSSLPLVSFNVLLFYCILLMLPDGSRAHNGLGWAHVGPETFPIAIKGHHTWPQTHRRLFSLGWGIHRTVIARSNRCWEHIGHGYRYLCANHIGVDNRSWQACQLIGPFRCHCHPICGNTVSRWLETATCTFLGKYLINHDDLDLWVLGWDPLFIP